MHPLLILFYGLLMALWLNSYAFGVHSVWAADQLMIICAVYTIFFPALSLLIMRGVGLLSSTQMPKKEDRWGPIIVCLVFYFWFYINVKHNPNLDPVFVSFVLGAALALSLGFLCALFSKVSLHAIAMGGLLGIASIYASFYSHLRAPLAGFDIHPFLVLILLIFLAGAVGTARLYLRAHDWSEVFLGFLIGFSAQFLAFGFL